ncbi:hypothetical protein E2562_010780 [Oryza meyeriana var. granulata]|uniref:FAD dependent oxidoreductase domain-containing protein n=1 Tax=Oryza meyeriana var. granulata TaxID=110450 RepID=A0A6G1BJ91_9ORYZ|nr:hypothetical protein E2562_010780 [Oryza meyeriana var. granulata]
MVLLACRLWADAEAESGYRVLTPAPQLSMGPRGDSSLLAAVENSGAGEADLAGRWDGAFRLVPDGWVTAVSEVGGGVLNATKAVAMFQALAVKEGAVVRDNAEVVGIAKKEGEAGVFVKTRGGDEFRGGKCVVTVGAWTSKLVKSIAGVDLVRKINLTIYVLVLALSDLPIQPLHTLVLYWKLKPGRERDLTAEAGLPTFSSYGDPHVYSTPSLELPGLIKINYDGGPPCDPDNRDWASGGGDVVTQVARWI